MPTSTGFVSRFLKMFERALIFAALLTLPTMSTLAQGTMSSEELLHSSTTTSPCNSTSRVSRNVFDFGLRLQKSMLGEAGDGNVVLSPTSLVGVLALTLLGSVGRTYDELVQSLGFSTELSRNQDLHRVFGNQLLQLNSEVSSKTLYATGVFVDRKARLRHAYRHFAESVYRATVSSVDFSDTGPSMLAVNQWVSEHTQSKIPKLLTEPLPPYTKVVLASALYFQGQWLQPFLSPYTHKTAFSRDVQDPSKDVTMDVMVNFGQFPYKMSTEYDCQLVALPYNDSVTTFYAIKPIYPARKSLKQLIEDLDTEIIERLIQESVPTTMIVKLPKMKVSTNTDLSQRLLELGIRSLFSPYDANLALMVDAGSRSAPEEELQFKIGDDIADERLKEMLAMLPNPQLYVNSVLHDVSVSIDEYGTEAVAATVGVMARSLPTFFANSPFFFFIRNEPTKLVTFSAVVNDPTQ